MIITKYCVFQGDHCFYAVGGGGMPFGNHLTPPPQLLDPFLVTFLDDSICPPSENQAGTRWFPALSSTFSLMDHNTINLSTVCEKKLYFTNA